MDRVRTFHRIAKENGRRLLVVKLKDYYYYYYLKYMSQDGKNWAYQTTTTTTRTS
jgi:mRNA degradation ribonuclease J1/J2